MLARSPLCVAAGPLAPGARVKVTAPVTVYHVPKSKGAATQLQGLLGQVTALADKHTDGSVLSCTMPLKARRRALLEAPRAAHASPPRWSCL